VLASKRASYAELLAEGKEEREIVALMDHQHRTMIAAIRHGKLDVKLAAMNAGRHTGQYPSYETPSAPARPVTGALPAPLPVPAPIAATPVAPVLEPSETVARPGAATPQPSPAAQPAPAARPAASDRTLDQVILEYLASELNHEQIECVFTPAPALIAGREAAMRIQAQSSRSREPIAGASIQVRVLSTERKGAIVFQGTTGADGGCPASFLVPPQASGSAAAVIRVTSPIGSTEFKFPVRTT
jgi:hypothetical protein